MEGKQLSTFVIALVSLLVTTIVIGVRCVVRKSIGGFGLDDWSMVIGQVCALSLETTSLQQLTKHRFCSLAPALPSCTDVTRALVSEISG
jgi:hypothetical protein